MSTVSTVGLLQHYLKRHFQCDIFPLRYDLKILSTTSFAQSPCAASGSEEKGRRGLSFYDKVFHHFPTHVNRPPPLCNIAYILDYLRLYGIQLYL